MNLIELYKQYQEIDMFHNNKIILFLTYFKLYIQDKTNTDGMCTIIDRKGYEWYYIKSSPKSYFLYKVLDIRHGKTIWFNTNKTLIK